MTVLVECPLCYAVGLPERIATDHYCKEFLLRKRWASDPTGRRWRTGVDAEYDDQGDSA